MAPISLSGRRTNGLISTPVHNKTFAPRHAQTSTKQSSTKRGLLEGQTSRVHISFARRSTEKFATIFAAILVVYYASYHYRLIIFPYQVEYREGAALLNMSLFYGRENLFSVINKPLYTEAYGVMYYIISEPSVALFGLSLQVLRGVTASTILLTCVAVFILSYKGARDFYIAALAAFICYPSALFFVNPVARPDGLGTLLFLAAIAAPWWFNFSYAGIAAAVLLSIAAFLTKIYFALPFVTISVFLFFFVSTRKGLVFIMLSAVMCMATYVVISHFCPTYFYEIMTISSDGLSSYSFPYVEAQFLDFLQAYWSLMIILLSYALYFSFWWCRSFFDVGSAQYVSELKQRLDPHSNYFLFASLISIGACLYPLGGNNGAYMTYFFQLITPCLAIAVARLLNSVVLGSNLRSEAAHISVCLLLCVNMITLGNWSVNAFDWEKSSRKWKEIERVLSAYKNILASPALVDTIFRQKKSVYDSGLILETGYVRPPLDLAAKIRVWNQDIAEQITARKFDLIVSTEDVMPAGASKDLVLEHYQQISTSTVSMPTGQLWHLKLWTPRKSTTEK